MKFLPPTAENLLAGQIPVIVTGAGGWLGMAALEMLEAALGDRIHTQVKAFSTTARAIKLRSGRGILTAPFATLDQEPLPPSLILHFAYLTRGHAASMPLENYIAANQAITQSLAAMIERRGALGLFVPSSGAVYRPDRTLDDDIAGNPYGVLKRRDEEIFFGTGQRLGFPTAIIRVFNLAGPYINNLKSYALASILIDIAQGGPIVLRAQKPVWRSYTHAADVLDTALAILLDKIATPVFDTAGETVIEIGDLARRAAAACGAETMPIQRPDIDPAHPDIYAGDGSFYHAFAPQMGLTLHKLDQQIIDTFLYLKNRSN